MFLVCNGISPLLDYRWRERWKGEREGDRGGDRKRWERESGERRRGGRGENKWKGGCQPVQAQCLPAAAGGNGLGCSLALTAALWGSSSPIGVPISVVVTQKVILSHNLVSGDFQWLVNRRQEIFT